jgi:hypothetical protein
MSIVIIGHAGVISHHRVPISGALTANACGHSIFHAEVIFCAALRNALGFSVGLCKVRRCMCLLTREQLGLHHVDGDCSEQWPQLAA